MQLELEFRKGPQAEGRSEAAVAAGVVEHDPAITGGNFASTEEYGGELIKEVLARENMILAYGKVRKNKGSPGIDGISTKGLGEYLKENWEKIKQEILAGRYKPKPVKRVEIPKPGGGTRLLGIPCVLDRLIQQALLQVMTPKFDSEFSESSFGFRPGRSALDAVRQSKRYIQEGYGIVVDIDIEKFFDRVNHDMVMARVARRIKDKAVLKLIRRYLQSGALINGICIRGEEGVPQGGPLSPLLANILLDDLDKELEKRRLRFSRYADDCNIYVRKKRSGDRVRKSIGRFLEKKLKLKVNESKSAVDRPYNRKFLGFSFSKTGAKKIVFSPQSIKRLKERIREMTNPRTGILFQERVKTLTRYLKGWMGYYALAENPAILRCVDTWMRRRLRLCRWRAWRLPRTKIRELMKLGLRQREAFILVTLGRNWNPWRMTHTYLMGKAMSLAYFQKLGLSSLVSLHESTRKDWRTAVYGPVRTVV